MADQRVLEPQLFLLEAVKQVFIRVRPMLFRVDLGVERCVLGCESFDLYLVHRSHSFRECE